MTVKIRENRLNSCEEAARRLRIPLSTLWRYIRKGKVLAVKIGHLYRIPETEMRRIFREGIGGIRDPDYVERYSRLNDLKKKPD